jgi:hypothetical protein
MESNFAINQTLYLNEVIKKKLIPFIKKNYPDNNYVYWPDLASFHYAKFVQEYIALQNINTVPKNLNAGSCYKGLLGYSERQSLRVGLQKQRLS